MSASIPAARPRKPERPASAGAGMTCCTSTRCLDPVPLGGGGWACRAALQDGRLRDTSPSTTPAAATRRPGWSHGAVLACPQCGGRAYSPGPAGLPERRCHAATCGHVWNPEA